MSWLACIFLRAKLQVVHPTERKDSGNRGWGEWWRERGGRELQCILMTAWDPIGVGDTPEAWGEYEAYAPQIARILAASLVAWHGWSYAQGGSPWSDD